MRLSISSTDAEPEAALINGESCPEILSSSFASNEEAHTKKFRISEHSSQLDGSSESLANHSVVESEDESAVDPDPSADPSPSMEDDALTSAPAELHEANAGTDESACISSSESHVDEYQAKRARVSDDEDSAEENVEHVDQLDEDKIALQASALSSTEIHYPLSPIPADVAEECATSQADEPQETSPASKQSDVPEVCTAAQHEDEAQNFVRTKRAFVDDNDEPIFRVRRRLSGS